MKNIRNFCIIAHIDHGKSTLADRLLEYTKTVEGKDLQAQVLDDMDLERERGITIKSHAIQMKYNYKGEEYILNLIDTPGHVDFSYEVSRSIAACEGALLIVDAAQGIQAQTISNLYMAIENDLEIIPIMNKIDLPSAMPDEVEDQIVELLGCPREDILRASGKTGEGVYDILNTIVEKVPAHVEHHAAPSERRPIGDLRIRNLCSASGFRWQQLPQRGDAIDDAPVGTAPDPYAGMRHRQAVPFRRQGGRIEFQHDISPVTPIYGDSAIGRQHLVHVAGRGDESRIGDVQLQPFREPVGPVAPYRFLRSGNQHGPFIRRRPGAGHEPHSHSQRSINASKCHASGHDQLPFAAVTRPFLRRASVSPY